LDLASAQLALEDDLGFLNALKRFPARLQVGYHNGLDHFSNTPRNMASVTGLVK
jgi:hypothetical protein